MTTTLRTQMPAEHAHPDLSFHQSGHKEPTAAPPRSKPELTRVLRWSGGIALAGAAVAFMCQGVYSIAPMTRHWIMLATCALLGLLGVVTGTVLKEEKGARAFLGFAAAAFPVLASQLGAMFFSLFGQPPAGMPQPLVFSLFTFSKVMSITGLTLATVVPVSYLAFRILARSQAGLLTGVFTMANLIVLLPVRHGMWVGAIIAAVACGIYWVDRSRLGGDFRLDNFEGRVARLMLIAPLGVMMGRTLFYAVGPAFYGLMMALAGAYLAFHWGRVARQAGVQQLCRLAGLVALGAGWLTCLLPALDRVPVGAGGTVYLILLPIAAILGIQSLIAGDHTSAGYRSAAAVAALLAVVAAHWMDASSMVSLAGLAVALAVVAAGTLAGEKPVFVLGCLCAAVSLGNFALQAVQLHSSHAWVALALLGIGVIFSATLIEKSRTRSLRRDALLWGRLKAPSLQS